MKIQLLKVTVRTGSNHPNCGSLVSRFCKNVSVCGFDNIFTSSIITPPLTSIDHRLWARCRSAVDQIVKQNDQGHGADKSAVMADKIEYAPQLMIRKSTGPARTSD